MKMICDIKTIFSNKRCSGTKFKLEETLVPRPLVFPLLLSLQLSHQGFNVAK